MSNIIISDFESRITSLTDLSQIEEVAKSLLGESENLGYASESQSVTHYKNGTLFLERDLSGNIAYCEVFFKAKSLSEKFISELPENLRKFARITEAKGPLVIKISGYDVDSSAMMHRIHNKIPALYNKLLGQMHTENEIQLGGNRCVVEELYERGDVYLIYDGNGDVVEMYLDSNSPEILEQLKNGLPSEVNEFISELTEIPKFC